LACNTTTIISCAKSQAPKYLMATGSILIGITILSMTLYFLQNRLKYYHEKVGVNYGQKAMPGEAWGEELYYLSKDVKRWRIIIGVMIGLAFLAQFCVNIWGSINIFGKIFHDVNSTYFYHLPLAKTNKQTIQFYRLFIEI